MGRKLKWWIIPMTVAAAGCSGWAFVGSPGLAYNFGTIGLLDAAMAWALPVALVGVLFVRHFRVLAIKYKNTSVAGIISSAHGGSPFLLSLVAIITLICYMFFITAQLKAAGLILSILLGTTAVVGSIIGLVVILVYVLFSGLRGVEYTDVVGFIFMILAVILVIYGVFSAFGGFEPMVAEFNALDPVHAEPYDSGAPFAATPLLAFAFYGIAATAFMVQPSLGQKYLSLEELNVKKQALLGFSNVIIWLFIGFVAFAGIAARILHPGLADVDLALPTFLAGILGTVPFTIMSLGIFSAILTSADSYLLSISANIQEALKPLEKTRPLLKKNALWVGRIVTLIVGVICLFWVIIQPPQFLVFLAIVGAMGVAAIITGPLILMFYWKGGTKNAAIISIIVTYTIYMGLSWFGLFDWVETAVIGMAISASTYVGISVVEKRIREQASQR